jgi:hypothetical protein
MISRRRYRRMLQTSACCGLSPPICPSRGSNSPGSARGPPLPAEIDEDYPGQFMRPVIRSQASGGATGPAKKQPHPNHTYERYGMNHGTSRPAIRKGPGADLFGESARPVFLLRWPPAGGR